MQVLCLTCYAAHTCDTPYCVRRYPGDQRPRAPLQSQSAACGLPQGGDCQPAQRVGTTTWNCWLYHTPAHTLMCVQMVVGVEFRPTVPHCSLATLIGKHTLTDRNPVPLSSSYRAYLAAVGLFRSVHTHQGIAADPRGQGG